MEQNTEIIQSLMKQSKTIIDIRNKSKKIPGEDFDIFSLLNIEYDEVGTHSKLIYGLLCPDECHGMGDLFLRKFFEFVFDEEYPENENVKVYREYKADIAGNNLGRIDLIIEGNSFCYPIEVKIYAGDQERQVERYMAYALMKRPYGRQRVFYLTLDGHEPSDHSLGKLQTDNICTISFADEISSWLNACGAIAWQNQPVAEIIRQYQFLIKKMTGTNRESNELMKYIQNNIESSRENYESAVLIAEALIDSRIDMMRRVFSQVEKYIGNRLKIHSKTYENDSERYYRREGRKRVWPSLTYIIGKCKDLTLALRFEVDSNFYFGLVFFNSKVEQVPSRIQELKDVSELQEWKKYIEEIKKRSDWWVDWQYLPQDNLIDFREFNNAYLSLYDSNTYDNMMNKIYSDIDEYLKTLKSFGLINSI